MKIEASSIDGVDAVGQFLQVSSPGQFLAVGKPKNEVPETKILLDELS